MKKRALDTILIADDLRTNRLVIKKALEEENYQFVEASNGREAVELAIEHQPSMVIMDGLMPVMDGFEAVKTLRSLEMFKRTPILMISSLSEESVKVKAIEVGVNDFISKPFEKMELLMRCRSYVEVSHINSHYILSTQNPYTKMPNKLALQKDLKKDKIEAILLIRINNFDSIDTFYGSQYGRILEKEFAKYLTQYFIDLDMMVLCYHTGVGEFVIKFDNYEKDLAHIDIHHFCKMLSEDIKLYEIKLEKFDYDVRATICFTKGKRHVVENAYFTMEAAIKENLPYVITHEVIDALKEKTFENLKQIQMVKKAIEEKRIIPYFQPIFDNKKREITKYETLVRIITPEGEVVSPYFFLNAAKSGNYYLQITNIMLEKVFSIFKYVDFEVTINLSYLDISSDIVHEKIITLLKANPDTAKRVTFELLEDEVVEDYTMLKEFIQEVRSYGVKIAIDDFGSGYSNFQRIMQINPDLIKIDGSIIKEIKNDSKSQILTEAINTFSHSLGIKTVAEFVSDEEIFVKVVEMGIDYTQGYYIGKPLEKLVTLQSHPALFETCVKEVAEIS